MWLVELQCFPPSSEQRLLDVLALHSIPFSTFCGHEFLENSEDIRTAQIYRGSCWFISQMMRMEDWRGSVFGTREDFRVSVYGRRWAPWLLNRDSEIWPLVELAWNQKQVWSRLADFDGRVFLRPDDGFKEFAGQLVADGEFEEWYAARKAYYVEGSSPTVAAKPIEIQAEYRCFLVDGRVVTASSYRPTISPCVSAEDRSPVRIVRPAVAT